MAALQPSIDDSHSLGEAGGRPNDGAVAVPLHPELEGHLERRGAALCNLVWVGEEVEAEVLPGLAIVVVERQLHGATAEVRLSGAHGYCVLLSSQ